MMNTPVEPAALSSGIYMPLARPHEFCQINEQQSSCERHLFQSEHGKGLVRQDIERPRLEVTRLFHLPHDSYSGCVVTKESDKAEAFLFVFDDRYYSARLQIFFKISEVICRFGQMMKNVPSENKIEIGFRQVHLAFSC